ncbi:hypothetical protein [Mucilaginibacter kameinonensis]|uniref:hypothetical protein n=1 Tax=Mucilaginibacter kameinonensis TaxID=452286 RepID=UPI0013CEAF59|nr:hypothetical protein [Mucilaginibacter kameinonensis]
MLNHQLTQQLRNEFESEAGNKLIPDNNPTEFAVFLYEKLLKGLSATLKEELAKSPENKGALTSFQNNLEQKLGTKL